MGQFVHNLIPDEGNIFLIEFGIQIEFMIVLVDTKLATDSLVAHLADAHDLFWEVVFWALFYCAHCGV